MSRANLKKPLNSVEVLGTPLSVTNYASFSDFCHGRVREEGVFSVDFTNTQIVTMRRTEAAFREMTSSVDYFVPDGMPLIWCMNRVGSGMEDRVYGPTFLRECLLRTKADYTHFFLGGSAECLDLLCKRIKQLNENATIIGTRDGYFTPEEEASIVAQINALSPDFIWVGLGTPKQQAWINRWKGKIKRGALMAVGYAFDVNAGTKADPPPWMQRFGLGWAFRLASEPRRLASRYFKYNSLFLFFLLWVGLCGRAVRRGRS